MMTTHIEKFIRWIYKNGNWGAEQRIDATQAHIWGQLWVHLFLGAIFMFPAILWWPLIAIPVFLPVIREFGIDRHPFHDLWVDTPEGIDCRSDMLSCWVGSAIGLPFMIANIFI